MKEMYRVRVRVWEGCGYMYECSQVYEPFHFRGLLARVLPGTLTRYQAGISDRAWTEHLAKSGGKSHSHNTVERSKRSTVTYNAY